MQGRYINIVLLSLLVLGVSAQNQQENGSLRFNSIVGYNIASNDVWKTHQSLSGMVGGFEIGYSKFTDRSASWHKVLGTPRLGMSFMTLFMNKPDTFGTCFSLLPNIEIRAFTGMKSELSAKIAIGATYCTKLFNNDINFDNRAVSSPLNFGLEFSAIYHRELTRRMELNLELSAFHVSNGSFKLPNGGYNVIFGKVGINYFFNEVPLLMRRGTFLKSYKNKPYYTGYAAFAYREQGTYWNARQFPIFTLHQGVMKKINKIHTIGVGLDAFYDATHKLTYDPDLTLFVSDVKESEKYHAALGACYELAMGKLSMPVEAYHFFYDLKTIRVPIYIRFGLKYAIHKHFFIGSFVKGNLDPSGKFESSFMEFATGWSFRRD